MPGTRDGWTRATALAAGFAIASDQQPGGILHSGPVPPISAQNAQIWAASILTGTQPVPAQKEGGSRVSHNRRAVAVGNKAPCPVWQVRCPAGQSRRFRFARACARRRHDNVTGNFPA